MYKIVLKTMALLVVFTSLFTVPILANASYSYGQQNGRYDTINVNDYSTNSWDRFEYNYEFQTGPNSKEIFGQPTQTDIVPRNPDRENIRRNKDAAYLPPSYGVFSGEFATEPDVAVFEGEGTDSMRKGVGHFEFTSAWSGNVGISGHNRGLSDYLNGIWNLKQGDVITYETQYGTRDYVVEYIDVIDDTDYSYLGYTLDNRITLITCKANSPNQRYAICGKEKTGY